MKKGSLNLLIEDNNPFTEPKNLELLSNEQALRELGACFDRYRLAKRIPDKEIFEKGGATKQALAKFKKGRNISLLNFIKILRGADLLPALGKLIEASDPFSPLSFIEAQKIKTPTRIRKRRSKSKEFKWGDE